MRGHRRWRIDMLNKEKNPGGGRYPAALRLRRNGTDEARRSGGSASMQARYRAFLQSSPARPTPDQGLHEGASSRALGALQGRALPSLAEGVRVTPKMIGMFTMD